MKGREIFKVEGDKITRLRRHCPKCGDGVFLAEHKDRLKAEVRKYLNLLKQKGNLQNHLNNQKKSNKKQMANGKTIDWHLFLSYFLLEKNIFPI